jgi:hypothetical protein
LAFGAHWPKAIHLGGGTVGILIDERADASQRWALENVAFGKLGGLPFEILATTFSSVQETRFVPFEFHLDGRNSASRAGEGVSFVLEPVKSRPYTKDPITRQNRKIWGEPVPYGEVWRTGVQVTG